VMDVNPADVDLITEVLLRWAYTIISSLTQLTDYLPVPIAWRNWKVQRW
jgi:hypothetical protein